MLSRFKLGLSSSSEIKVDKGQRLFPAQMKNTVQLLVFQRKQRHSLFSGLYLDAKVQRKKSSFSRATLKSAVKAEALRIGPEISFVICDPCSVVEKQLVYSAGPPCHCIVVIVFKFLDTGLHLV